MRLLPGRPPHGTEIEPRPFHSPAEIRRQVAQRRDAARKQGEKIDWLAFVPGGEPTLDSRLGEAIDALGDLGLPVAVISNASPIWREEVRAAPGRADWGSVKVDSTDEAAWRRINRAHPTLRSTEFLRVSEPSRAAGAARSSAKPCWWQASTTAKPPFKISGAISPAAASRAPTGRSRPGRPPSPRRTAPMKQ